MKSTDQETNKPQLDPSNLRLWVAILLFMFLFQDVVIPRSVLIRFIDHLLYGLIFQFMPKLSEPLVLIQQGLTYLILAWLFLRSVHRPMGSIGASSDAWKTGITWGLGALAASAILLFVSGGIIAGFDDTPALFGFLPAQITQLFKAFGRELCFRAFLQTSVVLLALRYIKSNQTASLLGIIVSTLFFVVIQGSELAQTGLHGMSLAGALIHTSLIFGLLISVIYAITNNIVLVSMIHGGFYFMSYWTVDGIYSLFPVHLFLVLVAAICLVAVKSNPQALGDKPLAMQIQPPMLHKG